MRNTVLVVDHDPTHRSSLERMLENLGYDAQFAGNGEETLNLLASPKGATIDLLMLDLVMPDLDGLGVLSRLKSAGHRLPVIAMVTPKGVDGVLNAISAGATDFIIKPVGPERLQVSLMNALRFKSLMSGLETHHHRSNGEMTLEQLGMSDPAIARLTDFAGKALKGDWPVLIEGESGTGKSAFARAIHASSSRAKKPFVELACSALKRNDSIKRMASAIERAKSGTLYLAGIDTLDPHAQAHLVQTAMVAEPSSKTPRLIVDSQTSLIERARSKAFREDLFYRLTVTPLRIPALKDRPFDLPDLAEQAALRIAAESGKLIRGLAQGAKDFVMQQDWPGNFPEFESAIRHAVRRAATPWLTEADFNAGMGTREMPVMPRHRTDTLSIVDEAGALRPFIDIESDIFAMAQRHCGGSLSHAAKALGLGRSTLYRKIQETSQRREAAADEPKNQWTGDAA
jgi:DNA-binding NtrC family response regulator